MNKKYDAIIIGAGVIGCPIAYELAKMGYKTLNVDKLSDAGMGSTAASCAIVRAHYSTEDGVAFGFERLELCYDLCQRLPLYVFHRIPWRTFSNACCVNGDDLRMAQLG